MPDTQQNDLEKRREALKQEISTIDEAIIDIQATASPTSRSTDQLQTMKSVRAVRQRELDDVESRMRP